MAEVRVDRSVQRERLGIIGQRTVGAGIVDDRGLREAREELVGKADALRRTHRVALREAVELPQRLEVVVGAPLGVREEVAEGREGQGEVGVGVCGDGLEGAQIHEVDDLRGGQIRTGEIRVDALADRRGEGRCEAGLCVCADVGVGPGLEGRAEAVGERVVEHGAFLDAGGGIAVGVVGPRVRGIGVPRGFVTLHPPSCGGDDTVLAGGADVGDSVFREGLVALVDFRAHVEKLL